MAIPPQRFRSAPATEKRRTDRGRSVLSPPSPVFSVVPTSVVLPFHAHRDAHAAADAQRGEAFLGVALLHLVEQRHQHPPTGGADRMADGDRSTIDVDLAGIPAEVLVDRAGLRG